ncbi:MAG: transposase family protein, partial [Sciscionella sp.]
LDLVSLPDERAELARLAGPRPVVPWDWLLFSAKESVYKAWAPLAGTFLDFGGAAIRIDSAWTFVAQLLARGFAVPRRPELRLHTLADVFAYAAADSVHLRIDGTEVQVRRPRANKPRRRAFVSGKRKQNTIKPTAIGGGRGRLLWLRASRPGRMHDVTALRTEGIEDLQHYPQVDCEVDSGYPGLVRDYPGRSPGYRRRQARMLPPPTTIVGRPSARTSRPGGSVSGTPSPYPSNRGRCSATSGAASTSRRPPWPSPDWSLTAAPPAEDHRARRPGQHASTSIAHQLVRCAP